MSFKGMPGGHHEPYWDLIKRIITESDLVLEILDARLVELSRNEEVERLIEEVGRPMIFVINKSDLVPIERLREQVNKLKEKGEVVFISTKKKGSPKILLYTIKKMFKKFGKREMPIRTKFTPKPKYREAMADIVVGVLGYPNVGKSSIINVLAHKRKVKVSKTSGTTHGIHWINITPEIKLIDSPGVIPLGKEDEIRYGLIGARDTEALKKPDLVAYAIIKLFLKEKKKQIFEELYQVEISEDIEETIKQVAKRKSYLLKGGVLDEFRAMTDIVRDWQSGRLRL
jgi:ribosome biogenesis GTPase A